MPHDQPSTIQLSPTRKTFSVIWALTPLATLGIATVLVIGSAAVRLARHRVWLAATGYLVLFVTVVILVPIGDRPEDALRNNVAMGLWFTGMWFGGTVHAFFLRNDVFRPRAKFVPPSLGGHSPASVSWAHPAPSGAWAGPPAPASWAGSATPSPWAGPAPTAPPSRAATGPTWDPRGTAQPADHSIAYGQNMVGPYRLTDKLGEGGQGAVYTGTAPDGRRVAIKLLHERFRGGAKERDDFMREVAAARRVPQFSTARIIDVGVAGDLAYIVSEYVPGPSLDRFVREQGRLDGDSLTRLAIATSAALNAIHSAGVVHRDFKPANVLLGPDGPRVIDFGIAKALDQVTTTGGLKGTPAYMAPEQLSGAPVGPESDIFSWAATMFFGATGQSAFGGDTAMQVFYAIINHHPDVRVLPATLRGPVAACFDKNPRSRPTAAQLMVAITS